jgi:chromosome segregation ATPase
MATPSNQDSAAETSSAPREYPDAEAEIDAANWEFGHKVSSTLESPLALLAIQRDCAIRAAHEARARAERERAAMAQQQDRFIAMLMAEHERELAETRRNSSAHAEPEPRQTLAVSNTPVGSSAQPGETAARRVLRSAEERIAALRDNLCAANTEADQVRAEVARVRAERDQAVADCNDLKFEYQKQLESAQDEVSRLTWQLDEARRRLDETRDEARDEAHRLSELLTEMRRELDERNEQVHGLRARLSELDLEMHSRPPPAAVVELEGARRELESLRHRFVDAKREQSRLAHELELSRARRRVVISIPAPMRDEPPRDSSGS